MMRFSETLITDLKAKTCIETLIGRDATLKRKAGVLWGLCPFHSERTPSFKVNAQRGTFHCFGCGAHGDVIDYIRLTRNLDFAAAVAILASESGLDAGEPDPEVKERRRRQAEERERQEAEAERKRVEAAKAIWKASQPAAGTSVETYLKSRGITIPVPPSIRYHLNLRHGPTALHFEAMVAAVQGSDGKLQGIHRTYLLQGGKGKARVSKPKMMLGICARAAVHLAPAKTEMVLAEGVESGLSVQQSTDKAVWACLSSCGVKAVVLPPETKSVIIAADNDEAGIAAAKEAARRFRREGREVLIGLPPDGHNDFNDALQGSSSEAAA